MKKAGIILLALFLLGSVAFSQEVKPVLTEGKNALLFNFSGLSFLGAGAYNGGIGAKYFLADKFAARALLIFGYASQTTPADPPSGWVGMDGKTSATSFGAGIGIEYHMGSGRVSPYVGGVLGFSTTSTSYKPAVIGAPGTLTQSERKNSLSGESINGRTYSAGTTFSLGAIIGVEFFLYNELSLGAEYLVGFSTTAKKDQVVTSGSTSTTTKGGSSSQFGITNDGSITLSIYF